MTSFIFKLAFEIILSIVLKAMIPPKVRNCWTPWIAMLYCVTGIMAPFLTGTIFGLIIVSGYFMRAFLLNGFQLRFFGKNPQLKAFLVFWLYLSFAMALGPYPVFGVQYFLATLIEGVFVSYFVGMWILQTPGAWPRFLRSMSIGAGIIALFYLRKGALSSAAMTDQMRVSVEVVKNGELATQNQNAMGLAIVAMIAYPFLYIMGKFHSDRRYVLLRWVAVCSFLLLTVFLVRTGSRNSCLTFLPIGGYLFFAKTTLSRGKRLFMRIVLVASMLMLVVYSTGSVSRLRIFTASSEAGGDITSGRLANFEEKLYRHTFIQNLFGAGGLYDYELAIKTKSPKPIVANGHSIYFQVFYQSGVVGCLLFIMLFCSMYRGGRRLGVRGHLALYLFFTWAFSGVGESSPILNEVLLKFLLGLSLAFCTRRRDIDDWQFNGYKMVPIWRINRSWPPANGGFA